MVVHMGGVHQITTVYHFEALNSTTIPPTKLSWDFMARDIRISLGPDYLFLSSGLNIYRVRAGFSEDDKVKLVYTKPPASVQAITDISAFFVAGSDCKATPWQDVGH